MASCLVGLLWLITLIYDIITLPIFYIIQQPWKKLNEFKRPKSKPINHNGGITFRSSLPISSVHVELKENNVDTMDKVFQYGIQRNGSKMCLGSREIIDETDEKQPDGKVFKKYNLGDYKWKTYNEVGRLADFFGKGLRELGMEPKDKIAILAETRAEWLISAIGAFQQAITLATLYSTLGDEAIVHGLNETEVEVVLTSHEQLPKFKNILQHTTKVKKIIYIEDQLLKTDTSGFRPDVQIYSYCDILAKGAASQHGTTAPTPDDIGIVMYTSGSTGVPKGVLLSHRNISTALVSLADAVGDVYANDVSLCYLPLAHVLELMFEATMILFGIPIGYSSALTLTDNSSKIRRGGKGDASVLRPTLMASVPLVLDRVYKGIQDKIGKGVRKDIFDFFTKYKIGWYYRGYDTPLTNRLIFKKVADVIGGRMRTIVTGGAPFSPDVHDFIRATLCCPVRQGYGLTETAACATMCSESDMSTGRVGHPLGCCDIKLVDWEEGNYRVKDKPNPRGEIIIGGDNVAVGYYKLPEATAAEFFEEDGRRWFRTGDIGEFQSDGILKIIDRKKDLVKLQFGEYVSLGKVESELKTCPVVDQVCIYADPSKLFCVALVVPSQKRIEEIAVKLGKRDMSLEILCRDPEVEKAALSEIKAHGTKAKLQKFEIPGAVKLCHEIWTPENELVTAAFKLKRKNIQDHYQADINKMYGSEIV